jgi:hypothetical protein
MTQEVTMKASACALFAAGFFFGGAVDHGVWIILGLDVTHFGLRVGAPGQGAFAALDLAITLLLLWMYRRLGATPAK